MENAGAAALDGLLETYGSLAGISVLLIAGGGNNGGDAFVLARRLLDEGAEPLVLHTRPKAAYKAEARLHMDIACKAGVAMRYLPAARSSTEFAKLCPPDILVDGLLGTGFQGELKHETLALVQAMNRIGESAFVLSLDLPSGLDGLTGQARPEAVRADLTVAFHAPKVGCTQPQAAAYVGLLETRSIGIPKAATTDLPARHVQLTDGLFDLLTPPPGELHKGRAGHVLVIGGSEGLTGAAQLSALGALRAGAGLVTVACPRGVLPEVKAGFPDFMALGLGNKTTWTPECLNELTPMLGKYDSVVIGPGMGRDKGAAEFFALFPAAFERAFDKGWASPCLYDADALYHLAQAPLLLKALPSSAILTPHPGEMARILGMGMGELQANRMGAAERFSSSHPQVLVLKGAGTLIVQGQQTCVSPIIAPNLAVGGSGDVLAGVIAALLARALPPMQAACLGVYWHGLCGVHLSETFPGRGNLPTEIAHTLPVILKERETC
jgi:NAD(P)H-hydrate epimerase